MRSPANASYASIAACDRRWLLAILAWAVISASQTSEATEARAAADDLTGSDTTVVVALAAPLTTVVRLPTAQARCHEIIADITVPAGAPADLGVGAFVADRHESWFQRCAAQPLRVGLNQVRFAFGSGDDVRSEPALAAWGPDAAAKSCKAGLFFWATRPCAGLIVRYRLRLDQDKAADEPAARRLPRIRDLRLDGKQADQQTCAARTGERWQMTFAPDPFPANPFAADEFRADAVFTAPDGSEMAVPAFVDQPMRAHDRGDREEMSAAGGRRFCVRFRPRQPGRHRLRLDIARPGSTQTIVLPDIVATGAACDPYVRVDRDDPRFFALGEAWHWPIGVNLRSVNDVRCQQHVQTLLTPDRGSLSYAAYLKRFGAAGIDAVEIWLAAWNLGLEWRHDWFGFHGVGRYNDANACRLDRVLDEAWANGIRVNLVINNHGQGSIGNDHEWEHNPFNAAIGGPFAEAGMLFSDARALAAQENHRRYLVARYADHPAILAWKLWSEIDLTMAKEHTVAWHERAARRWRELDTYDHPITTHWSADYHVVDRAVVALPGIDFTCIDAYHGAGVLLARLIADSALDAAPGRGLAQFGKPLLITEYGGYSNVPMQRLLAAESACANWVALVSGHGGAPMLWWYEWVDQGGHWQPYAAIARFIRGEDPRGRDAASIVVQAMTAAPAGAPLWSRAWARPGCMLGYVLDESWGAGGPDDHVHTGVQLALGVSDGGAMRIEWWDADQGAIVASEDLSHAGGALTIAAPDFRRHLAFKLRRMAAETGEPVKSSMDEPRR
ncbi:MAG: hypothetical protein H0T76_01960 [Nannocystis sp.]|nr:hypothetical protein [Nannocystis sp.]MBA3545227.1 hypothetical protein [Nannocystis sp.]